MKIKRNYLSLVISANIAASALLLLPNEARSAELEEIIVSARKVQESMQDVPVTVSALNADTLEKYSIDDTSELADRIPNLTISKGGSGSGGQIRIRGVGSSSISAAFDSAVAFNVDGLQVNASRYLFQGMFDLEQVEVLKGPQSLYFGKSASAGVLTMHSKNPTDEFEAGLTASYEFEEDGTKFDGYVSGPLTDTLSARLAARWMDNDEVYKNTAGIPAAGGLTPTGSLGLGESYLAPGSSGPKNGWRGEEETDIRLTLDWNPTDSLNANLKVLNSEYENDGETWMLDIECLGTNPMPTAWPLLGGAVTSPVDLDCSGNDGVVQLGDMTDIEATGIEVPNGGVPFYTSDVQSVGLAIDYDLTNELTLTSVTGWINMESEAIGNAGYASIGTPNGVDAINERENFSQEFRLDSNYGGTFDFAVGVYYQTRDILFDTYQTSLSPTVMFGPDPSGRTTSNRKIHNTETDAWSAFLSMTFRPVETVEMTVGARHSHEEHEGKISVPYTHYALQAFGLFLPNGTNISGIEFEDDDLSPEASVKWQATDSINLYAAYKTGFKSGGIDNSALPTVGLNAVSAQELLVFQSETVEGFEVGMKSDLLDNTLRFNASVYQYTYKDLQTQEFDVAAFNFVTLNAGELESKGAEIEATWLTPMEGLMAMANWAYSDSRYTDEFFVTSNDNRGIEDLNGTQLQGNSRWSGNLGLNYEVPVGDTLVMNFGVFSNYRSSYQAGVFTNSYHQDGYWKTDATIGISSQDDHWQISLIGQNLEDKRTITNVLALRPGGAVDPVTLMGDQITQFTHGRQVTLEAKYRFF
jgi:iron complex outermembrane recepter protein